MSEIKKLIERLCPDGVEWKKLGELGGFYGGLTGKSKKDFGEGNAKFITYMNVFSNPALDLSVTETVKIAEGEKQNRVQYGDILFTGSSETPEESGMSSVVTKEVDEDYYLNSFCFGFRLDNPSIFNPDFLKHFFRSHYARKAIAKTASGVTRFNISKAKLINFEIPVPPMEVQRKIVEILDNFTELEAELEARRKQYEYYRNQLLTFDKVGARFDVKWMKLGEVAEIGTGSSNTNEELEEGKYPFFVRSQVVRYKNEYEYDETAIITSGDGVGVGKVFHYVEGKYALHQRAYRIKIISNNINSKFFYYYMRTTFYDYIMKNAYSSSVTSVRRPMLIKYPVPIPPLSEQHRIVSILDRFEALTTDLQSGLPAEIEARRKQYEYYREKLLTFKRKAS